MLSASAQPRDCAPSPTWPMRSALARSGRPGLRLHARRAVLVAMTCGAMLVAVPEVIEVSSSSPTNEGEGLRSAFVSGGNGLDWGWIGLLGHFG